MRDPIWVSSTRTRVLIGGHRGASAEARENTLAAFEAAIAAGADFIETDLRLSRDGVPVCLHDRDLARIAGDPRPVAGLDFDELKAVHAGVVATEEALDLVGDRASVLLDTKLTQADDLRTAFERLAPRLLSGRVALGLRSFEACRLLKGMLLDCPVVGLLERTEDPLRLLDFGVRWARLWQGDASATEIARLQDAGLKVLIMVGEPDTVGQISPAALDALMARRPDAMMLNDVRLGLAVVKSTFPQTL